MLRFSSGCLEILAILLSLLQITPPLMNDDTVTINHLALDILYLGSYLLTGLKHDTHYQFRAVLVNAAGRTAKFTDETNTTIGEQTTVNISHL